MKKALLLMSTVACITVTYATTHIVRVTNFQFSPANIPNVVIGDVIRYEFAEGFHNATSNGVPNATPAGAAPIHSGAPSSVNPRTYDYTVTRAGEYRYVCEVHGNPAAFTGMIGTFTASAALPAALKAFTMTTSANKKPFFEWTTLTEENVSHFSLRSSVDGFNYNEAGRVIAAGNSRAERSYSFTDNLVPNTNRYVYYLLAIVDKDGSEKLSQVRIFKNPSALGKLITQFGPNPIKRPGQLMIQFNSEKTGKMATRVIDASGKVVLQTYMAAFPGLNNGHLHVCDLNPGVYTLQFTIDGLKENKKIVIH